METSANTSIKQVPAMTKKLIAAERIIAGDRVFDYGCGKWPELSHAVMPYNTMYYPYDPWHQPSWITDVILHHAEECNIVLCNNVLNVLEDFSQIFPAMLWMFKSPIFYFSIYEGNKSGIGKKTSKGYQRNEKKAVYEERLGRFFHNVKKYKGGFVCTDMKGI